MPTGASPLTELTSAYRGQAITIYSHTGATLSGTLESAWETSPSLTGAPLMLVLIDGWPAQHLPGTYQFVTYEI